MKNLDKYRGCLIGGAAGDALGYAVEFLDDTSIFRKYGKSGITAYAHIDGIAQISDDTQMTLFTANGLLLGTTRGMTRGIMDSYPNHIASCYQEWLRTQRESYPLNEQYHCSWLVNFPELFCCRAPGNTCLSAIQTFTYGKPGTIEEPINHSKGCGGIMRVAPIGLYFEGKKYSQDEIDRIGAETAALTHGHQLGYIPAAALVHIIHMVAHNDTITLLEAVINAKEAICCQFADAKHLPELLNLLDKAITLSLGSIDDLDAIKQLGEGWVAEETLAIAVYCALKHSHDFEKALIASVNHSGDSDSTGAVTGNILGAYLGLEAIPQKYVDNLELRNVILELADDLYNDCKITEYGSYDDEIWKEKYICKTYRPDNLKFARLADDCTIIIFPDFVKLKMEVEKLRTEISMLLLEKDELLFVECKNIETAYMLALGALEYKAYELNCAVLRLKRKIELIQAKKNRQEKIILSTIEAVLNEEFAEYKAQLEEQMNKVNSALERSKGTLLSDDESRELKKLYRTVIKALHPDLHPDINDARLTLFHNAVASYENGDLNGVRIICEMVADPVLPDNTENGMTILAEEKERLSNLIQSIRDKIAEIKNNYPYTMKPIVHNKERIAEKKAELQNIIEQLNDVLECYKNRIVEMLR